MHTRLRTRPFLFAVLMLGLTGSQALASPVVPGPILAQPDAAAIAGLTNQYLQNSIAAANSGDWLDATPAGSAANRGQSLAIPAPIAGPGTGNVTIDAFNDSTTAMITANDGAGDTLAEDVFLTQFNVTYSAGAQSNTLNTFCIDLFHTVTAGQTYAASLRTDLATAYGNGARMAYIIENYGGADLSSNPDQAAAVQIALWDLSLNNHDPMMFAEDADGSYSSGDPSVFSVNFNGSPVPEPRSSGVLLAGLILIGVWRGSPLRRLRGARFSAALLRTLLAFTETGNST
jgi:hypothetical protein